MGPEVKACKVCGEEKEESEFQKGWTTRCTTCALRYWRNYARQKRYGITIEQYELLLATPCGVCGKLSEVLDHCHATGIVRAALCSKCNKGLGHFEDSPDLLRAAAQYLERHRSEV